MLRTSLNTIFCIVILCLCMMDISFANAISSTYEYVPKESLVMSGINQANEKEKSLFEKNLTEGQKREIKEGHDVVKLILKDQEEYAKNNTKLLNEIVDKNQKNIKKVYETSTLVTYQKNNSAKLYYFISFSMPLALIKSYMLDAIWNGGTLVVRGSPRGVTLAKFLNQYILPLVSFKGGQAKIEINPNLFEMYDVQIVPTLLIVDEDENKPLCHRINIPVPQEKFAYSGCKKIDPKLFWKISGAVTSLWALNELKEKGAPADLFISRMKHLNYSMKKEESGFEGNWANIPLPHSDFEIDKILKKYGFKQLVNGALSKLE